MGMKATISFYWEFEYYSHLKMVGNATYVTL